MADSELGDLLLKILSQRDSIDSYELAKELGKDHQTIVGAINSLRSLGNVIKTELRQFNRWELTKEGAEIAENGSHEVRVFLAVDKDQGILHSEIIKSVPNAKVGLSKAISAGWLKIKKGTDGEARVLRQVSEVNDELQTTLKALAVQESTNTLTDEEMGELRKRKLITNKVIKSFIVTPGSEFSTEITKLESEITTEMIQSGSWKEKKFKPYNFDALGMSPQRGQLHPLMKVRAEIRQIFLEMGFTEMPTNNFIESSFWNFDALFQPQQHPARDQHDTFFLKDPKMSCDFPMDYVERVKKMHEVGGHGSLGYRYDWKLEEAQKNILRTHTTAVSARMLYKLGQQENFTPVKYFSIDRVFRNEALDATHLAEFHQIEGLIADNNLALADLMGVLNEFFSKMGIGRLRFKPAYNPYTEPSMEVFSYHEGLQKWVEVGNSGVFRPEMLLPMGLPEDVSVIAWGLSLERPTMIKYGVSNIRELVGHKVNLEMVQNNPLCRLDT